MSDDRLSALETELAHLRRHAEQADTLLALLIGFIGEISGTTAAPDLSMVMAGPEAGWMPQVMQSVSTGREMARAARQPPQP